MSQVNRRDANAVLSFFDKLANAVERSPVTYGLTGAAMSVVARYLDSCADLVETRAFGADSLARRRASMRKKAIELPSEHPGGKPSHDDDFEAGFKAATAAYSKDPSVHAGTAEKLYRRLSSRHGTWWIDGFTAAVDLARGAYATMPAQIAREMRLASTERIAADPTKADWEQALKWNEASLAKMEKDLKAMQRGEEVPNLTIEGARNVIDGLKAVIKNNKALIRKMSSWKAPSTEKSAALNRTAGHHFDGKDYHVDTAFINAVQHVYPGSQLRHLGFGEFVMETPDGELEFDRMRGKPFEGQSGRSHKLYDNAGGKVVRKAIQLMERSGKSQKFEELKKSKTAKGKPKNWDDMSEEDRKKWEEWEGKMDSPEDRETGGKSPGSKKDASFYAALDSVFTPTARWGEGESVSDDEITEGMSPEEKKKWLANKGKMKGDKVKKSSFDHSLDAVFGPTAAWKPKEGDKVKFDDGTVGTVERVRSVDAWVETKNWSGWAPLTNLRPVKASAQEGVAARPFDFKLTAARANFPEVLPDGRVQINSHIYTVDNLDQFLADVALLRKIPQRLSRQEYEFWARKMRVPAVPDEELGAYEDKYGDYDLGHYFGKASNRKIGWHLTLRQRRWWAIKGAAAWEVKSHARSKSRARTFKKGGFQDGDITIHPDGSVDVYSRKYLPDNPKVFVEDVKLLERIPRRLTRQEYEKWARRIGVPTVEDVELGDYGNQYANYDLQFDFAPSKYRLKTWALELQQRRWFGIKHRLSSGFPRHAYKMADPDEFVNAVSMEALEYSRDPARLRNDVGAERVDAFPWEEVRKYLFDMRSPKTKLDQWGNLKVEWNFGRGKKVKGIIRWDKGTTWFEDEHGRLQEPMPSNVVWMVMKSILSPTGGGSTVRHRRRDAA